MLIFSMVFLNCLIIEDDPNTERQLTELVKGIEFLRLIGISKSTQSAFNTFEISTIDLIIADAKFLLLDDKALKKVNQKALIIVTSVEDMLAQALLLDGFDYLVKPLNIKRFYKSMHDALACRTVQKNALPLCENQVDFFFVKSEGRLEKVNIDDILYIEAFANYVLIHTKKKKLVVYLTFKGVEQLLNAYSFLRVHKSYLVPINKITQITGTEIIMGDVQLPFSRNYREQVMQKINKFLVRRVE